jgi:hypothetical protein
MSLKNSFVPLAFVLFAFACNNLHEDSNVDESKTFITNDTIPEMRSKVNPEPVAEFVKPLKDTLNHWKFAVSVFETKYRFKYILRMEYQTINETDTLRIPNFGTQPKVEIHNGSDGNSCIIGFLNDKNEFKEYKQVAIKDNQMKLTTLKKYFVGVYRTVSQ